jgi:hypothetical protein
VVVVRSPHLRKFNELLMNGVLPEQQRWMPVA